MLQPQGSRQWSEQSPSPLKTWDKTVAEDGARWKADRLEDNFDRYNLFIYLFRKFEGNLKTFLSGFSGLFFKVYISRK